LFTDLQKIDDDVNLFFSRKVAKEMWKKKFRKKKSNNGSFLEEREKPNPL